MYGKTKERNNQEKVSSPKADGVVVEKERVQRFFLACHFLSFLAKDGSEVLGKEWKCRQTETLPALSLRAEGIALAFVFQPGGWLHIRHGHLTFTVSLMLNLAALSSLPTHFQLPPLRSQQAPPPTPTPPHTHRCLSS